jgi:hypothetical protein
MIVGARNGVIWAATLAAALWCAPSRSEESSSSDSVTPKPVATFDKDLLPFLKSHCFHCHGNGKAEADLTLDRFKDGESVLKDRKLWDNVAHMVRSGEMPPKERPRPMADDIEQFLKGIDGVLASLDCTQVKNVGRVTLRRLNRVEYNNTIRDLVGVDFQPAADFPADDVGYGFDNIGDVLSTSPLLLEKYLAAAETIMEKAIVVADPPEPRTQGLNDLNVTDGAGERRRRGAVLHSRGSVSGESYFEPGDYVIKVQVYGQQVGDEPAKMSIRVGRGTLAEFEVKSTSREDSETFEAKTRLSGGTVRISAQFLNPFTDESIEDPETKRRQLYVRSITLEGPFNAPAPKLPASHERLMRHPPDLGPRGAAAEIVGRFARRAFRRPVQPEEVERILAIYDLAEREGEPYEERIRLALCRVLVSPHFLFRIEQDPAGAKAGEIYAISEHELASRLSYFLWSTMPDEDLLALADRGELRANLRPQVARMLKDPKSSAFVENFAGQWLTLRKLDQVEPDKESFPLWNDGLRRAMRRETELFFEAILREDRSILDFLDADFTFVNGRLAHLYGIPGVLTGEFERVQVPAGRGGLLTQASILTITSNPTRTAPVKRGKWVLEQLLGTPPPPPPPNVPELPPKGELKGSLRQVMEQHRENAICASCHARMDPIGFAFENYDAIGAYREKDGEFPIDASGELPGGQKFNGPSELKTILQGKKELFARALSEKILTYALGRGVEYYDQCAIDKIVAELEKNDYKFSTMIVETVMSDPFLMRTATGEKP